MHKVSIVGIAGEVGLHPERPEASLQSGNLQLHVAGSIGTAAHWALFMLLVS